MNAPTHDPQGINFQARVREVVRTASQRFGCVAALAIESVVIANGTCDHVCREACPHEHCADCGETIMLVADGPVYAFDAPSPVLPDDARRCGNCDAYLHTACASPVNGLCVACYQERFAAQLAMAIAEAEAEAKSVAQPVESTTPGVGISPLADSAASEGSGVDGFCELTPEERERLDADLAQQHAAFCTPTYAVYEARRALNDLGPYIAACDDPDELANAVRALDDLADLLGQRRMEATARIVALTDLRLGAVA